MDQASVVLNNTNWMVMQENASCKCERNKKLHKKSYNKIYEDNKNVQWNKINEQIFPTYKKKHKKGLNMSVWITPR